MVILLSKFDFSHVKMSNAMNLVMFMNNSRSLSLSLRQCQVNKVLGGRHHRNFLEVVMRHAGCLMHAGTGHSRNFRRREQEGLPPSGACCTSLPGAQPNVSCVLYGAFGVAQRTRPAWRSAAESV